MQRLVLGAAVVVLIGIGIGALRGYRSELASMAAPAVAVFNTAVDSITAAIGAALGIPRAAAPSPSPAPEAPPIPRPRRSAPRASAPAPPPLDPVVEPETVETASAPAEPALVVPDPVVEPVSVPDIVVAPVGPYDANDTDVIAPKATYPEALTVLPMGFHDDGVMAIEIVVNEAGRVDQVKGTVRPRTLSEFRVLLNGLSAAKTWRFQPATRDGASVKYRLLIALDK